jgi:hypothetical protein
MGCDRRDIYTPKTVEHRSAARSEDGPHRLLTGIPLTDDERDTVGNDHATDPGHCQLS